MILAKQGTVREYNFRDDVWRFDMQNLTVKAWYGGYFPKSVYKVPNPPFYEIRVDRVKVVAMDASVISRN